MYLTSMYSLVEMLIVLSFFITWTILLKELQSRGREPEWSTRNVCYIGTPIVLGVQK